MTVFVGGCAFLFVFVFCCEYKGGGEYEYE